MKNCVKVFSTITLVFVLGSVYCQPALPKLGIVPLMFGWIEKPPYVTSPTNGSSDNNFQGIIRDAMLRYIMMECGYYHNIDYQEDNWKVDSEFQMIELLRQNKVHIALPIFENADNRKYSEFPFFKFVDYPGSAYITTADDTSALGVVLDSVLKAWPLLAVTLVLTAIAGVIIWALDTYWNSEEFPRSFIKGTWDGFWYGDKSPKSIVARIFSIIWIMLGLIVMAIFTANITSALTAASLELKPDSLQGLKVGVLGNGTEYQHALQDDAHPAEYHRIEDIIQALNAKQVDGMLLDNYAASYFQKRGKLKSLITVTEFEFGRDVGVLFSKNRKSLADCLTLLHSDIMRLVQSVTAKLKLAPQKSAKNFSLFDDSSHFVKQLLYVSLGVLGGLLLIGTVFDFIMKKAKSKHNVVAVGAVNGLATERQTIRDDLEATRSLLRQMEENLSKLEGKLSRFYDHP